MSSSGCCDCKENFKKGTVEKVGMVKICLQGGKEGKGVAHYRGSTRHNYVLSCNHDSARVETGEIGISDSHARESSFINKTRDRW